MEIVKLNLQEYQGKKLAVRYQSNYVYEAVVEQGRDCFGVSFQRRSLSSPVTCGFTDVWGSEWLENPELYAISVNGIIAGKIEIAWESWTRRLRISNLLIEEAYRGQGCATSLLAYVRFLAKERGYRCLVLETQSCNDPAIQCYLRNGFQFLGCDLSPESNQDSKKHNVRIEMVYYLQDTI